MQKKATKFDKKSYVVNIYQIPQHDLNKAY